MKLLFVTGNQKKVAEAAAILGDGIRIEQFDVDLHEIQTTVVKEVVRHKIEAAYEKAERGAHVICEDTGLCFADINQFPGALIKFYHKALGNQGIVVHHGGSRCTATTVIGYRNPEGTILFEGSTNGTVASGVTKEGFGWDPIFIPDGGGGRSYAEMTLEEKNAISHRGKAFEKMKTYLSTATS
jgi:inosine triphosphate pyrophosphatase